jgi:hypothetical protein
VINVKLFNSGHSAYLHVLCEHSDIVSQKLVFTCDNCDVIHVQCLPPIRRSLGRLAPMVGRSLAHEAV